MKPQSYPAKLAQPIATTGAAIERELERRKAALDERSTCAQPALPPGQVLTQVACFGAALEVLEKEIARLNERLAPISTSMPERPANEAEAQELLVPVADVMRRHVGELIRLTAKLSNITNLIQL